MSSSDTDRLKAGNIVKLVGVLLLVSVLSVCSGARAIEIVQEPMEEGQNHNFLKLGESEVLLNWDNTRERKVSNVEKTLWALTYHAVSNWDDFDLVLESKDKTVLFVEGMSMHIDAALKKKKIVPDFPYDHSYTHAVSIDGNVITCDFRGYAAHKGNHEGQFKVLVTEVQDGVTLEPYAMDAPIPSAPKMKRGHLPPGVAPRKSSKQATTKQTDTSLSSATATFAIVKAPFHVNAEKATDQNFLVVGDWRVLLPLHEQTSKNLCNTERTLCALPYADWGKLDVVFVNTAGQYVVIPRTWLELESDLVRRQIIPSTDDFEISVKPVSVENDTITCRIDGKGDDKSKAAGKEYHAQFRVRVKETAAGVDLEPLAVESTQGGEP
jgi:hypothetical protein